MAAESSSSSPPPYPLDQEQYDVFLSFRGEDTRLNFTSHLHAALCRKNILTFIDDKQIERGDEISFTLLNAIERSKISIIIFSEKYATSRWCLNELMKIMECKKTVIPIFYHIDPTHVRNQSGPYEDAFAKHEIYNQSKVQQWRTTLKEAGSIAGWTSSNRLESELVESIVEDVLQKLNYMINPQVPSGLVGIHKQIDRIESLLCNGSTNVRILGIWGMGGIGKTTLAAALFKKLSPQFEGCCFLENVREELKNHGKIELRNKLLTQILGDQKLYINTPSICSTFVVDRLQRRKVLIVLDDMSKSQQIEDLIGHNDFFGPDRKIIVTTRDKDVLKNENGVLYYEIMQLNIEESLHLFSLKAFHQDHPKEEFRHISEVVVNYAKGLPLALKVLGSLLYSKSQREWESTLKKLKKFPNAEIHHVLSLSYEGLDPDEQNIFLDIACCLKGETKWRIQDLLDGCGFFAENGLRSLENKSLISISEHHIVNMHDMIQEMGWQIVQQESRRKPESKSRLWDPEEIYHVLKRKSDIDYCVESISLDMSQIKDVEISPQLFARMHNLRLLKFYLPSDERKNKRCNVHIPKALKFLLDELRYLRWDCFPLKALPKSFQAEMLVELDLKHGLIQKLWEGKQDLKNLKSLCLSRCENLIELPDLCKAERLEEIHLDYCTSLYDVPSSIFSLDNLFALNLEGCEQLQYLRSDIHSKSLRWLKLDFCSRLEELSVTLEKLEYLSLAGTAIEKLPSSVGQAMNLCCLNLSLCKRIGILPNNIYQIGSDTSVDIFKCPKLEKLPPIFETSLSITRLSLEGCSNLLELPDNLGLLSALKELSLRKSSIETLPGSIKLLSQLRTLDVSFCKRLRSLPELPLLLQELDASGCISLETVLGSAATAFIQNCFGSQNKELLLKQFHESKVTFDREAYWERFDFANCTRLDENGRKTIIDEAAIRLKFSAFVSSTLEAYCDPYHQFHLLFKDPHLEMLDCSRRRVILEIGCPVLDRLRKVESSALIIKLNANCCSDCKSSPFAFRVCWSNKEEISGLSFDNKQRVCLKDLDLYEPYMMSYDKFWFNDVYVRLPGSRVPRLFRYQATQNRITIQLASSSHLLGFAFCLVFSPVIPAEFAEYICEFHLNGVRLFTSYIFGGSTDPTADTIVLCYAAKISNRILEAVKESIPSNKSERCNLELSFEFYEALDDIDRNKFYDALEEIEKSEKEIKECGVWPIYASNLEPQKNEKLKKKRKRSLVLWNQKFIWQALIKRSKKNTRKRFFKHRNGAKFSSISNSRMKERMPNSLNEQQQVPPRKKSRRS